MADEEAGGSFPLVGERPFGSLPPLQSAPLPQIPLTRLVAAPPPDALLHALYGADAQVALAALVATDPLLQPQLGGVYLVQPADWPTHPGAGWILAPFVRSPGNANVSRFSDGSYGVWYGADTIRTAQAEVGYHLALYLSLTAAIPSDLPRHMVEALPSAAHPFVDLRPKGAAPAGVLDAVSYAVSQPFGAACRRAQQWGFVWPSVRAAGGTCVGVLRPPALAEAWRAGACMARWTGNTVLWL